MASESVDLVPTVPLNRFANVTLRQAKADLHSVENADEGRASFGAVLRRAVELAGLAEKDAADRLGVDRAQFSRWFSGKENAQVWKFHADPVLGPALIRAQAEATRGVAVRTVIDIPWAVNE